METDLWPCRTCKGKKAHSRWCTEDLRQGPQRTLRSQSTERAEADYQRLRVQAARRAGHVAGRAEGQATARADLREREELPRRREQQLNQLATMAPVVTTATPTPTTSTVSNTGPGHSSGSGPPESLEAQNARLRRERSEEREQRKAAEQENAKLKAAAEATAEASVTGTPSRPPPISENTKKYVDSNLKDFFATLLEAQKSNEGNSMATRKLSIPKLQSHTSVTVGIYNSWSDKMLRYAAACNLFNQKFETQKAILLESLHEDWHPLIETNQIRLDDGEYEFNFEGMVDAVGTWVREHRHALLDRISFLTRKQREGENVDGFITSLTTLLQCCRFEEELDYPIDKQTHEELMLRDAFITGLRDPDMRRHILERKLEILDLANAKSLARLYESSIATSNSLDTKRVQAARRQPSAYKKGIQTNMQQRRGNPPPHHSGSQHPPRASSTQQVRHSRQAETNAPKSAYHRACMQTHTFGNNAKYCPAVNHKCSRCHTIGHLESSENCSKFKRPGNSGAAGKRIRALRLQSIHQPDLTSDDGLPIKVRFNGHAATWIWLPDTGAEITGCSISDVERLIGTNKYKLKPLPHNITAIDGHPVQALGTVRMSLTYNGCTISVDCHIFPECDFPVLSKQACIKLKLLPPGWPHCARPPSIARLSTRSVTATTNVLETPDNPVSHWNLQEILNLYPQVFNVDNKLAGMMKGHPVKIVLKENAVPFKLYKPYTTPIHYEPFVRAKLDKMLAEDVIEYVPAEEVPIWTAGLVVVDKKDSADVRITVDLSHLNKFVRRPGFQTATPAEQVRRIPSGMAYFTTLDARHGYWQVALDKASRSLTTFLTTTHGLVRYKVLPMGLNLSSDSFNKRIQTALSGLDFAMAIVEDILIFSRTLEEHKEHVHMVLKRCAKYGIHINSNKVHLAQTEADWCGFRLSEQGYTPSPRLTKAIAAFPRPQSITDVRSFVGLVNFFKDYDDTLSEAQLPLNSLMSPKVPFIWTATHQQAFDTIKTKLTSTKVLAHFIPNQPLKIETDASRKGLGFAVWIQCLDNTYRLLMCGSRSVSETESKYAVTELELLAVTWALNKAKFYCAGAPQLELIVDHKPLVPIINHKSLGDLTTPRIQRLKERLQRFPHLVAIWRQGSAHTLADALSRHPVDTVEPADLHGEHEIEEHVASVRIRNIRILADASIPGYAGHGSDPSTVSVRSDRPIESGSVTDDDDNTIDPPKSVAASDLLLKQFRDAAKSDSTYRNLHERVLVGFPAHKTQLQDDLKPFWKFRNDLSVFANLVMYKDRTIVPQSLKKLVLDRLHAAHMGETKSFLRAKHTVFWPGITSQLRDRIQNCTQCQLYRSALPRETELHNSDFEKALTPGLFLSLDFFSLNQFEFLVISDNFSGYFRIYKMGRSATASDLIKSLRDWISLLGHPIRIRSDGGPQMDSTAYRDFCSENFIQPSFSSPHTHCHTAEAAVKAAKNILRKCTFQSPEYYAAVLEFHSTPRAPSKLPPYSLMYKFTPRTLLPVFRTSAPDAEVVQSRRREYQKKTESRAHALSTLSEGQAVLIQNQTTALWDQKGTIIKHLPGRRSYYVQAANGARYWRNRRFLQPVLDTPPCDRPPVAPEQEPAPSAREATVPRRSARRRRRPARYDQ